MAEARISTGAWWDPETWARARAAYVYDLDHNPKAPAGFIQWLHWMIDCHAARGPHGRTRLHIEPRGVITKSDGLSRHHPLRLETVTAMELAIIDDRAAGRLLSRSAWIHEAVTAAITDAERRAGGALPAIPVEVRLPNQPTKARRH